MYKQIMVVKGILHARTVESSPDQGSFGGPSAVADTSKLHEFSAI